MARSLSLAFTNWITGMVPGAADLNRLQNNDEWLSQVPFVRCGRIEDVFIQNNTLEHIDFRTESSDTDGMHSGAGELNQYITIKRAGVYAVSGSILWASPSPATPTGVRHMRFVRNDTQIVARDDRAPVATSGWGTAQHLYLERELNLNDKLSMHVMQTQGATVRIEGGRAYSPIFTVRYVREPA